MGNKKKIVFFYHVLNGDFFLNDIIENLSDKYETRKVLIKSYNQIDEGMKWADICWFEWCEVPIIYASKQDIAKKKKIICRLHSYEAFNNSTLKVNWNNVDKLIFVAENIRNIVLNKARINKEKTIVIPNGVNVDKYTYKQRKKGFNIAYIGYINFKKGPMLLLHTLKSIVDKDNRYKLYIAGAFQEERYRLYFNQMKNEMGLENNIIFDGWQNDINKWLEDKNYVLCTSVLESQNMSVMESMSKGIKPIVHNFVGAKNIYNENYVWSSINEAVEMITSNKYDSIEYRKFIEDNYGLNIEINRIKNIINNLIESDKSKVSLDSSTSDYENYLGKINNIENLASIFIRMYKNEIDSSFLVDSYKKSLEEKKDGPLVTVGITNYNYANYLDSCLESILNQDYKNIEIIIVDDCSQDNSKQKINNYLNNFKNIKAIFHETNSGEYFLGFKEIIKEAKGDYLMPISADDRLAANSVITNLVNEFKKNVGLDFIYGDYGWINKYGRKTRSFKVKEYSPKQVIEGTFRRYCSAVIPLTLGLYNIKFLRKNNNFISFGRNKVGKDTLNTLVYVEKNMKYKHIDEQLFDLRMHGKNRSLNVKERIYCVVSVTEYIQLNFDEEIYMPKVDWSNLTSKERMCKKHYCLVCHYYDALNYHYLRYKNTNNNEILLQWLKPFVKIIDSHIYKSLKEKDTYKKDFENIKKKIKQLYNSN